MSDASREEIAPDALWAIEALEQAREATELGPAFAAAEREKRRLGQFWRLEFMVAVLAGVAGALWYSFPAEHRWIGMVIASALWSAVILLRLFLAKNSRRVIALKRVNDAIDRWRSMVPAMREMPR